MIDKICWLIVNLLSSRTRIIWIDSEPYLLRCYLKKSGIFPGIYLHRFYKGDSDRFCHNHPWETSVSFILTSGYFEERLNLQYRPAQSEFYERKPLRFNIIKANDFHKVHLVNGPAWTLFTTFNRSQNWGFFDTENNKFMTNEEYFKEVKNNPITDLNYNKSELFE